MGYVLVDTCVWINIASTPALHPLVEGIQRHASPPHKLVIPASGRIEFERNRTRVSNQWVNSMRGQANGLKHVRRLLPGQESVIDGLLAAANATLDKASAEVAGIEASVAKLVADARQFEHSDADFRRAGMRAIEHRPPACDPKRSSTGDCLLWETAVRLLDEACVWFCTANHHDFSAEKREDHLHPELEAEVKGKKHTLRYFNDPSKMIDHLDEVAKLPAKPVPRYADYFPPTPSQCWKCGGELRDAGFSPSHSGAWTWKMRCIRCGAVVDTGDPMDD